MVTTLALTLMFGCAPMRPPPPQDSTLTCEGADQVRRGATGEELGRWRRAPVCTRVRCEGTDYVRRDLGGREVERWVRAPAPFCPAPAVKLTSRPGWKFGLSGT